MSAYFCSRLAARLRRPIVLAALALAIQGCTARPQPYQNADASDPDARVPASGYRTVLGSYAGGRPAEPSPWRERNDSVAPAPKRSGQ
jgi:hypothetical protein